MESGKSENVQSWSVRGAKEQVCSEINSSSPSSDFFNQNPKFLPQPPYDNHPDWKSIIGSSAPLINNPFAAASSSISISKQKNPRKRNRPSRRVPTMVLMTDVTNFRQMVQTYTGIPTPPATSTYSHSFDLLGGVLRPPVDNLSLLFSSPRPPPPEYDLLQVGHGNGGIRFPLVGFGGNPNPFPS